MSTIDLSGHGPWLRSRQASRRRRAQAAREARRSRVSRGGAGVLLAVMTLAAGGAVAHDKPATTATAAAVKSAGGSVVALQRALGVTADGQFGPLTRRAVRAFQRRNGLAVDGVAGPATLAKLGVGSTPAASAPAEDAAVPTSSGRLAKIAACESGGNPAAISADGRYRGKYQFSRATWRAMGGKGDPAKAAESVQDAMAAKLLASSGSSPWPNCG